MSAKRMNPEVKAEWVEALRSDTYKQGTGALRNTRNEFCCFGVLCDLYDNKQLRSLWNQDSDDDLFYHTSGININYEDNTGLPPKFVLDWAGVNEIDSVDIDDEILSLAEHNDSGKTFTEIAKAIEEQL